MGVKKGGVRRQEDSAAGATGPPRPVDSAFRHRIDERFPQRRGLDVRGSRQLVHSPAGAGSQDTGRAACGATEPGVLCKAAGVFRGGRSQIQDTSRPLSALALLSAVLQDEENDTLRRSAAVRREDLLEIRTRTTHDFRAYL